MIERPLPQTASIAPADAIARYGAPLALAVALVAVSAVSLLLGQDANWDLRNYHFYNAYAFLNDRLDRDLAPAQVQSYINPALDLPFYWAVRADLPPRLIAVLLALPAGVAIFFLCLIVYRLFRRSNLGHRRILALAALVIGSTGAAGAPLIGTTMNDWQASVFIVIALWCSLKSGDAGQQWLLLLAGLSAGVGSGLKLTCAVYALALCVAILATRRPFLRRAVPDATMFSGAVMAGLLASSGFWMWRMYAKFGNPLFPYYNDVFRSPWWDDSRIGSEYGPHSVVEWISFPFRLIHYNHHFVGEPTFRDWRIPFVLVVGLLALTAWLLRRASRRDESTASVGDALTRREWRLVMVFWFASLIVWIAQYSIYRYIIPLELLSGPLIVAFLASALPVRARVAGVATVAAVIIATTHYPKWGRVPFGTHFFQVDVPALSADAMIAIVEDAPVAYLAPFFDPRVRFVGSANNFNDPWRSNLLAQRARRSVIDHKGPLYLLQVTPGWGNDVLQALGVEKGGGACTPIRANVQARGYELCELVRTEAKP